MNFDTTTLDFEISLLLDLTARSNDRDYNCIYKKQSIILTKTIQQNIWFNSVHLKPHIDEVMELFFATH